jgi:hypothetical protein
MSDQTVLWIALPNGMHGTAPKVTVFIAPQLATSALTPDFTVWPKTLAALQPSLRVAFGDGQPRAVTPSADGEPADPDLWSQLFPTATVEPFVAKSFSQRLVRSFPARRISQHLESVYREIAETSPGAFPSTAPGSFLRTNVIGPLESVTQQVAENEKRLGTRLGHGRGKVRALRASDTPFGQSSEQVLKSDFFQLYRFYYRPKAREPYGPLDPAKVPPRPIPLKPDFHRTLALLADYPKLLRLLGLALDLEVPGVDLATLAGPQTIQVRFDPASVAPAGSICPKTHYTAPKGRFVAAAQTGSLLTDGMLALEQGDFFDLYQLDLDGASLKHVDFAASIARLLKPKHHNFETPSEASLPSLRSGGLTVGALDRAARLVERMDHIDQLSSAGLSDATELFADDVVRGFRLDVLDTADPKWRSLHERHGTYTFAPGAGFPERTLQRDDEGYVKGPSPTSSPAEPDQDLYLHEAVFGWDGWSLAAPRPGHALRHDRTPPPGTSADHIGDKDPDTATPLDASFRAQPGSLPRLRFARRYRIRARAVDLAGNSLAPETDEDVHAIPPKQPPAHPQGTPYGRLEPIPSPVLLRRFVDTDGESLERIVIRSDVNTSAADYVQRPDVQAALAGKPYTYRASAERHVVPPKASQLLVELHGRFDTAFGPAASPSNVSGQYGLAKREAATLLDVPGVVETPPESHTHVLDANGLKTPYLPDPLTIGVAFDALPGDPSAPHLQTWSGAWPDLASLRLRVEDGTGPPAIGTDLLTVNLPQAERVVVRYSSFFDKALLDTDVLAIWRLISPAKRGALAPGAGTGQHWMLTPYRSVELVHAVQHPLTAPQLVKPALIRSPGETFVAFRTGTVSSHAKSTGRLEIVAQWTEPIDRPTDAKPDENVPGAGHVCAFTLAVTEDSARLAPQDKPATAATPLRHRAVHEFGDTKHRVVQYRAVATTRFREYFAPEITADPKKITQAGDWVERAIPSSARPAMPVVARIVPTFGWKETPLRNGVRRTRQGNALRVWMERGWWSSGAGELLGVVLREPGPLPTVEPETDPLKGHVTDWGMDPLWTADAPPLPPAAAHFPKAVKSRDSGLLLDELATTLSVGVAGHQPVFNGASGLWYCDIEIAAGSAYFPFVRLALARYQPNSLPGLELSRVVLSDFIQIAADRTAAISFTALTTAAVTVTGAVGVNELSGKAVVADPAPIPHLEFSRRVRVALQQRDPHVQAKEDPLGWVGVSETDLALTNATGRIATWNATLNLPADVRGKRTHRLLITESEVLETDAETKDPRHPEITLIFPNDKRFVRERIVYADEVVL